MTNALALAALVASIYLLVSGSARIPAVFATVASGLEVLMVFGVVHLSVSGFPVGLVLGVVLLVAGILAWMRVASKSAVSAATVAALVGLVQVLRGLRAF